MATQWSAMSLNLPENADSAQQRDILDSLPALIFLERAGRITFANAEARQALGLQPGESIQRPLEDVLWGLFPGTAEPQTQLTGGERGNPFHATLVARNGRMQPVEGTYCVTNAEQREAVIIAHAGTRERAPRSRLMEDVLSSIPEAVVIVHEEHILYTNPAFTRMFGYTAEEATGAHPREFIVPETRQHEIAIISYAVDHHGHLSMETVRKTKAGDLIDVSLLAGPLVVNGTNVGYAISYRDIGERKQVEAKLQHDAMHDVLTGLPNRALFLDRLTLAFSRRARRRDQGCGVLFIDLDRFKVVNDTLGHATGDSLLVTVADRLRAMLRPQDTAARLGGDEFAVLIEGIQSVADMEAVATRVARELAQPYLVYGHTLTVGASIGVALAGPDHSEPESLVRDADYAMYQAKQAGGARFEVFDRKLEFHLTEIQERERELRHMLDQRQFELWYEPVYVLADGKLAGFESVLRCDRDSAIFRDLFALAEDTGLSIGIGRDTIETVCRQLKAWQTMGRDLTLSVKLTQRQFYHQDLVAQLAKILAVTGADPTQLMIEVSESTLNGDPDAAVVILQRIVDLNVHVAVDEFGASLAPVNYLVRLPLDVVKMDPKLTASVTAGGRSVAVLETLIHLGRLLGVQVVAQGIETAEQLDALRQMGCELGQGPLMSAAVDLSRAERLAGLAYWTVTP
jgi:Amt family ammonium transporter